MRSELEVNDNESLLLAVAWTTAGGRREFNLFPEVLFADVVHGTNREKRPLLQVCGKDAHGDSFIVLQCFMPLEKQWIFLWCFTTAMVKLFGPELLLRVQVVMTDGDNQEIHAFEDAIAALFVNAKMRRCFWHLVEQKFDMITATFKEGSSKMKVFNHLKGWINQLATCPETVEEHNFCKKEMLNWFSSSKIRNLVGSALVNQTLLWMNTSLFVHEQRWARVSYVNVPTFKNKCSTLVEGNNNFVKHKKSGVNANMHIDDSAKNMTS